MPSFPHHKMISGMLLLLNTHRWLKDVPWTQHALEESDLIHPPVEALQDAKGLNFVPSFIAQDVKGPNLMCFFIHLDIMKSKKSR